MREILVFCVAAILQATGNPFGYMALSDVNSCLLQLHQQLDNKLTTTTSGIVGVGWDDLTNEITLPIFATTFYKCKTTPDGHFLIPDNVLAVPIQEVFIDRSARSYKSYNDVEKESIKANRHDINGFVGGGTFAKGNQETKKYFSHKNTMMFEVKIGYKAFIFIAEDTELDNAFRGKIDEIVESLDRNLPILAKYQAECIIRDYGTHIVNKALTGASMKYKAFVNAQSEHSHSANIAQMEKDAAFSFLGLIGGGEKSTSKNSISGKTGFEESTQYTTIETKGGSDVRKILNAKDADAVSSMDNIVGLEQEGIPIYTLIHKNHFPEEKYDSFTLFKVQQLIFNATKEYYEENTVFGCTDPTAENFDYQANYDEGESCNTTKLEFLFDGVFQRVGNTQVVYNGPKSTPGFLSNLNLLYRQAMTRNHPLTNNTFCPEGYDEIMLTTANLNVTSKSSEVELQAIIEYKIYWCRRINGTNTAHKGALFGGFIIDGENVITRTRGCPTDYDEVLMFENIKLCLSYKYDIGKMNSISFGGFYSCETREKDCPKGYSAHLLKIHYGCAVYYCVLPYVHNYVEPTLVRPPFIKYSEAMVADIPTEIDFEFKNETMATTIPDLHGGIDNSTNSNDLNQKLQSLF